MRRDFHEHMDMFSRQNAGDDLDAKFFAQLPDNRSYPLPQRAFQHLVAILRDPDDVIPMVKNRVTRLCRSETDSLKCAFPPRATPMLRSHALNTKRPKPLSTKDGYLNT